MQNPSRFEWILVDIDHTLYFVDPKFVDYVGTDEGLFGNFCCIPDLSVDNWKRVVVDFLIWACFVVVYLRCSA
mgnify:CR=1 FL=1